MNPNSSSPWFMTVVYTSPQPGPRIKLWEELCQFGANINHPWCLAGDFNVVLHEREKIGGVPFIYQHIIPFADCIDTCKLMDLGFKGPCFT